jgi:Bacterial extracellular solute-binding proteins, family 5 Middle
MSLAAACSLSCRSWPPNGAGAKTAHVLTFKLREGVRWHDGRPFTAQDVKCTWELLLDKAPEKLRLNPRKTGFDNIAELIPNGDYEITFNLKRPQPAFLTLLADGFSSIYPCHVSPNQMRQHPIGRSFQVRRIQAERVDQSDSQPRLLEVRAAVSRWHRIHHHQGPSDARNRAG